MRHEILMVDDNVKNLKATKTLLETYGFSVTTTASPDEAISLVKINEYALILLDFHMEKMGDVVAAEIKLASPRQQIAMYSCDLDREIIKQSFQAGAVDFIEKNRSPNDFVATVRRYCNRYEEVFRTVRRANEKSEIRKLIESVGMRGQSEATASLTHAILQLAEASNTSVHIRGPSGSGKELAAQALHKHSPRAKGPFVAINCAAIPRDLLESTLFGHKRGSFTGATGDQEGKFVQAHGGTIFLDEIAELPLELQAKLLRVTQEREVEPLGGRSRKIDVRIISATHRNIEKLVSDGLFREDLMYRIKVVEIEIAPLSERPDDIEPLVEFFTEAFNEKRGYGGFFQRRTLDILKRYSWPGNVRELANVVERHLIMCGKEDVRPEDLDLKLYDSKLPPGSPTLMDLERKQMEEKINLVTETILRVGSKAEAARRLGITAPNLQYILNQSKAARATSELNQKENVV
jgi:DNA-binding NtrC family response regulator